MTLLKNETKQLEPRFGLFDRMLDDWTSLFPVERPRVFSAGWMPAEMIRVDEYQEDGTLVVKAELPGIDPDKDVELTVSEGVLHIAAERREEEKTEEKGYMRKELRYGSFARTLPLPKDVSEADVKASYRDGILEIRVPAIQPVPAKKVPITKS